MHVMYSISLHFKNEKQCNFDGCNTFKPEFTIVIFIHYKPRIAKLVVGEEYLKWVKK